MNLLDFIFLGFVLVTVLIGLKKGFAKMIGSTLCILLALVGAVAVAIVVTALLKNTVIFANLAGVAAGWFQQSFMTAQVSSAEELAQLLSTGDVGAFSVLAGLSEQIFTGMQTAGVESLGGYLGGLIATVIIAFVVWLIAYLILKYSLLGIKKLLRLLAGLPVIKSLDKIVGVIASVAFGYLIVVGILYPAFGIVCAKFLPQIGPNVISMVENSTVFYYIHHSNFLGSVICDMFQVNYSTFAPIA